MKIKYQDLVDQTFNWPQDEFHIAGGNLHFNNVDMRALAEEYGTPLKLTFLPSIRDKIRKMKDMFRQSMARLNYGGEYNYCYVTKSGHFPHIIKTVIEERCHLETSSAIDLDIIRNLRRGGWIDSSSTVLCNGYKPDSYIQGILDLSEQGFENIIPILDNRDEIEQFGNRASGPLKIGIRIAAEEEPKFEFYTSRLGIRYKEIPEAYNGYIKKQPNLELKMLHFFVNTGIRDNAYYWNEFNKCLNVYCELAKMCPTLDSLNIGGGFPFKNSLVFEFDYEYMIETILKQIKDRCDSEGIPTPHIYTEFGSYTVAESGAVLYRILGQKQQNDREKWSFIDSSFMTTLPDSWAINSKFIMLPLHRWDDEYERVFLGGLTCDSDDYYNSEQHVNAIYLPKHDPSKDLFIGFFHTGAYQDTISGYKGVHHCLMPQPKHLLIDLDENSIPKVQILSEEQTPNQILDLLGYTHQHEKNIRIHSRAV